MNLPKMPKNLKMLLGFDALIIETKDTIFITRLSSGRTDTVSVSDLEYLEPTPEEVADIISNRIASDIQRDAEIERFIGGDFDDDKCPCCGS